MTVVAERTSIGVLLRRATARLRPATTTAALDARLLVAFGLGLPVSRLALADDRPVGVDDEARIDALIDRRVAGEPVARITGEKEFWSMPLRLSPEALVPRPDTETLVEAAIDALRRSGRLDEPLAVLDLGTGSGAILLALLSELPSAFGIGVDRAPGAVATAWGNAERLGFAGRASFVAGDWATPITGRFDVVVSNPPYVESDMIGQLPLEVGRHDPHLALDGGDDGFDGHRAILAALPRLLVRRGLALVEIGAGQASGFARLASDRGFVIRLHRDIAGIERVVEIELPDQRN